MKFRFAKYGDYPHQFARAVHPGLTKESQNLSLDRFFGELRPCCRNREFSKKVFEHYGTAEKMREDKTFMRGIQTWATSYSFTDMWSERFLARIRQASDASESTAERVCSSGYLCQLVTEHMAKGFDDPRSTTRGQLMEDGVPLRCVKQVATSLKPCGPFVHFMKKADEERKCHGIALSRKDYVEWQRQQAAAFHALSEERMAVEVAECKRAYSEKLAQRAQEEEDGDKGEDSIRASHNRAMTTLIESIGDQRSPYMPAKFAARVRAELGLAEEFAAV